MKNSDNYQILICGVLETAFFRLFNVRKTNNNMAGDQSVNRTVLKNFSERMNSNLDRTLTFNRKLFSESLRKSSSLMHH